MSKVLEKVLDIITPWRKQDVMEQKKQETESEVVRSEQARGRLRQLNESYRLADVVFVEKRK